MKKNYMVIGLQNGIETGVIDQSNLLTFFDKYGNSKVEEWITKFEKIAGRKDPVIIICRSGRRSRVVANYLVQKENYLTVYHATNGIKSWIESNNKIVEPEQIYFMCFCIIIFTCHWRFH